MGKDTVRQADLSFSFFALLLLIIPLFVLGSISGCPLLTKPSFNRFASSWTSDPLQKLFIATICFFSSFVGSCFRLLWQGSAGIQVAGMYAFITVGLLVGQLLGYHIFRKRIVSP